MIVTDRRVRWKSMKKTQGGAPGLLAYLRQLWRPMVVGLVMTVYVLARRRTFLYVVVLPYTVSVAVSPWVQYSLARPPAPTSASGKSAEYPAEEVDSILPARPTTSTPSR